MNNEYMDLEIDHNHNSLQNLIKDDIIYIFNSLYFYIDLFVKKIKLIFMNERLCCFINNKRKYIKINKDEDEESQKEDLMEVRNIIVNENEIKENKKIRKTESLNNGMDKLDKMDIFIGYELKRRDTYPLMNVDKNKYYGHFLFIDTLDIKRGDDYLFL